MSLPALLPMSEMLTLLEVVQQSFSIRRHYELFRWLQEDLQDFLPHDILIAAWGDFSLGLISYDIVSPLPGVRTEAFDEASVAPFVTGLFLRWLESNRSPFVLNADNGFSHAGVSCSKIDDAMLFSESNSRFVVTCAPEKAGELESLFSGLPIARVGAVTEARTLKIGGVIEAEIEDLRSAFTKTLYGI